MNEVKLIRFVVGPSDTVVPDLGRKLPGRGIWVAASREAVNLAALKGLFSRAAKTKLVTPPDIADRIEALMLRRLLSGLGLARKAGDVVTGFEKTYAAISAGRAAFWIEAIDGAADGRRKLAELSRRVTEPPRLIELFNSSELSLALGAENVVHMAFLAGRGAERWSVEVHRLAGFRPLCRDGWDC